MAIVVIGGHSRNVGKTSVVAGLIAKLPAYNWTAFKLTQFGHGRCSLNGKPCQCETADHAWAITEEKDRAGKSDSSRFLVAGAKHAFWVRTAQGKLEKAMPGIRRRLDAGHRVGCVAGRNLSPAKFVHALLDCHHAIAGGPAAIAASRHFAIRRRRETAARKPFPRFSAWLSLRNFVVLRKLLLGLQHDEAVWRHQRRGSSGPVTAVQLVPGPLSWIFRAGHYSSRKVVTACCTRAFPRYLGRGRTGSHSHQRLPP